VTTITYVATDVFGNQTVKTQRITISDTEKPVLVVPPSLTRQASGTSLTITDAELGTATTSDNSGAVTLVRSGVPAGNVFPVGTTTITYTATDAAGNVTTGTQTVTVTGRVSVIGVAATDANGGEHLRDPIVFTVTRTESSLGTVTVNLGWSGTATHGNDYTVTASGGTLGANAATITLAPGVASATITVTPVDDTAVESTESVTLTVTSGAGYLPGSPSSATASIADDDAPPALSIADATVTEGDKGTQTLSIRVTLSAPSATRVTVVATTVQGSALGNKDFKSSSVTLTFNPGDTVVLFNVSIIGDRLSEPTETFTVSLSRASANATIADGSGTVTILDNDSALTAAQAAPTPVSDGDLDAAEVASAVAAAREWWSAAGFETTTLANVRVRVVDLPGALLGETDGDVITLDADAAGWGWSSGRIDLFEVVLHEMGHALGLSHDASGRFGVMAPTLAVDAVPPAAPPVASDPWAAVVRAEVAGRIVLAPAGLRSAIKLRVRHRIGFGVMRFRGMSPAGAGGRLSDSIRDAKATI
jgi:hypothetical protein